jgi:hypothetical protein
VQVLLLILRDARGETRKACREVIDKERHCELKLESDGIFRGREVTAE